MRVLAAALFVLLLVAICSQADAELGKKETHPATCCFSFISRPIPRSVIRSAYITSNSCTMQAVVLVTRNGKEVCANPNAHWVQKHLKHLALLKY